MRASGSRHAHDLGCQYRRFSRSQSFGGDVEGIGVRAQDAHSRVLVPQSRDHLIAADARPLGVYCDAGAGNRLAGFVGKITHSGQARDLGQRLDPIRYGLLPLAGERLVI